MPPQPLPVEVRDLRRAFGRRPSLAGVDLEVRPGEIVGLIGPNGSGKTTLMRVLAGSLRPGSGAARVFGHDPFAEAPRVLARARFAFAPPALYGTLTAREHLRWLGGLHGGVAPDDVERALAATGLVDRADDRVGTYSYGMRQRLALALALVPRPELAVLDEPTDGLDPLAVVELRGTLRALREGGAAVLLASHLLVEVEELVDRLVVLSEGRALFDGTPAELVAGQARIRVEAEPRERALALLVERGLEATPVDGSGIALPAGALDLERARELLAEAGSRLTGFHVERPTVERALLARLRGEVEA